MLTPELAAQALEDIASKETKSAPITPGLVIEAVANSFQLTPSDLKSRKRDRETALARQVAMYLLKQATNCSLAQIGLELGNRDHSTVIHASQKIATEMDNDPLPEAQNLRHPAGNIPLNKSPRVINPVPHQKLTVYKQNNLIKT